jgi:precorrin-6B methylase 2
VAPAGSFTASHAECTSLDEPLTVGLMSIKQTLKRILPTPVTRTGSTFLDHSLPGRRAILQRERIQAIHGLYNGVVQAGPFKGLALPAEASWDATTIPCIVGSYEQEIHGAIEELTARRPSTVVNVGAAVGYYAVGFARRLPDAQVWAFDVHPDAQRLVPVTAALNGVGERVHVAGRCTALDLNELADRSTVLIVDCEGCEDAVLDPVTAPRLRDTAILVELHDFVDATISQRLLSRFESTHDVTVFAARSRDVSSYPALAQVARRDRAVAIHEGRPVVPHPMEWALLTPVTIE